MAFARPVAGLPADQAPGRGQMPGAAVTMNPYVAAAKFVLGKQATERDVQAMGKEIAKQIADYARAHGVGTN